MSRGGAMKCSLACHPQRPSVVREGPAATGRGARPLAFGIIRALHLIVDALREIFDENAYARFLQRRALEPSRVAYDEFLRENARARERRPRCC
jgi:hypothetical protein